MEQAMEQNTASSQAWTKWLGGAAIGAAAMYLSDPDRGRRRRALLRDKTISLANQAGDVLDITLHDLNNRMQGLFAEANRMLFHRNDWADDRVLVERVRAKIGRAMSHPHPVHVTARQGWIILSGPVLAHEKTPLLQAVKMVPGVAGIEDNLEVHENAEGMPSLQGEGRQRQQRLQENWPPSLRAAALLGGCAVGYYGATRRAPANILLTAIGIGLMARGVANRPLFRSATTAHDTGLQAIELHKNLYIEAAPETVFDVWSRHENFPRFMSNVIEVRNLGNGRSHWVVSGPAGSRVEWDSTVTESVRPWVLSWKSEPGATVEHAGTVRLEPADTGTRVSVQISYRPPAGALGQAAASLLFNGDPRRQMDEDLLRMKAFIESGGAPREPVQPAQSDVLH